MTITAKRDVLIFAAVVVALTSLLAASPAEATPGAMCFGDGNCGYGEICVKEHSWSPSGTCIKGSR